MMQIKNLFVLTIVIFFLLGGVVIYFKSKAKQTKIAKPLAVVKMQDSIASEKKKEVRTPQELITAIANAKPGDQIFVHGGIYKLNDRIVIKNPGTDPDKITLTGDPNDKQRPLLDFSSMDEASSNQGIYLKTDFWYIKGLDIYRAGDNGMLNTGSNNVIEFCTFSQCSDTGLQLDKGASNNTIINCDSYFNADSKVENADGFAAKMDVGSGNQFIGCRAWQNLDDGWDGYLRGTDDVHTSYKNCWAFKNGYLKNGAKSGGDGNGFKTGGSDSKLLKHNAVYINCVAAGNVADGFDHNSNRGEVMLLNCSAYDNDKNFGFGSKNPVGKLTIKNCLVLGPVGKTEATEKDISGNSWDIGVNVTESDFQNLDINQLSAPRKEDGELPDISFMHLVSGSDLIDKGMRVGIPYQGDAPDIGAFEYFK